ncbi:unnamed protein product [Ectocarpus fasciculatus]
MNFENIGNCVAKICNRDTKRKITNVCVAPLESVNKIANHFTKITLPDNEIMQHMPYQVKDKGIHRQILYISGASGSGKSYYTSMYLKEYIKMFPKNFVYIFSSIEKDKNLDDISKRIKRIKLNEKFYNTPLKIDDFKDCLVIYDDTEMITNPMLQEKLNNIKALIMTTGRHTNTFYIETSHVTGGIRNKLILIESHSVTLFLISMGYKTIKYFLETSFGFSTDQIRMIMNIDSRWITLFRTQPITIMYESGMFEMRTNV